MQEFTVIDEKVEALKSIVVKQELKTAFAKLKHRHILFKKLGYVIDIY